MLQTKQSYGGMVVAPHHLAAEAGLSVLEDGGNAIEAMIAAAAAIAVVYPHMNGLGGDGFWLIGRAGEKPVGIRACGRAARGASRQWYAEQGHKAIPARGPHAALTVAGTVDGWSKAFEIGRRNYGGRLPLARLLADAIRHAKDGAPVTQSFHNNTRKKLSELQHVPGFAETFLAGGESPAAGARLRLPKLAGTLEHLAQAGLQDFYRGDLARSMASDLEKLGSPLRLADFEAHQASEVAPLSVKVAGHTVYNLPPPTQGLASLLLLAVYGRKPAKDADGADYVHHLVEATKAAFRIRNAHVTDPDYMRRSAGEFLTEESIAALADKISPERTAPWPDPSKPGDTVWLAATDRTGLSVSFIQSLYWEFGSGVVLPGTGIVWQNRGTSFELDEKGVNALEPGRLPFHTIQPAMAELSDGRLIAYGTMGGEGQPQTQGVIFTRYGLHGKSLQEAVTAPRWLLGRTWGEESTNLKIESRYDPAIIEALRKRGHDVQVVGPFEEFMGHAGAIVHHPDGLLEGASDPRSDGTAAAR
jgi:gamma-glutamyltranspeptidase/glutathione hydrolase